jgi:hypothetical protein
LKFLLGGRATTRVAPTGEHGAFCNSPVGAGFMPALIC